MKNRLLLLLTTFILFSFFNAKAQNKGMDTIRLLKDSLLGHISEIRGKPFSVLLKKLPPGLPLKSYIPYHYDTKVISYTEFSFLSEREWVERPNVVTLLVIWRDTVRDVTLEPEQSKSPSAREWKESDVQFYEDRIIGDIRLWVTDMK